MLAAASVSVCLDEPVLARLLCLDAACLAAARVAGKAARGLAPGGTSERLMRENWERTQTMVLARLACATRDVTHQPGVTFRARVVADYVWCLTWRREAVLGTDASLAPGRRHAEAVAVLAWARALHEDIEDCSRPDGCSLPDTTARLDDGRALGLAEGPLDLELLDGAWELDPLAAEDGGLGTPDDDEEDPPC